MRARIKKTRPALSKGLMRSDIENNTHTHTHTQEIKMIPPFLHYMQLQKD